MEVKIKYHRPQSEVKCYCCGNILKDGSEIRRTEKLGKNTIVRLLVLERVEFQILKVMSHFYNQIIEKINTQVYENI
jgi:Fe-S oxidoreductase